MCQFFTNGQQDSLSFSLADGTLLCWFYINQHKQKWSENVSDNFLSKNEIYQEAQHWKIKP